MRYLIAAMLWLLPSMLICSRHDDYTRAGDLVRRTLKELSPRSDAAFDFRQTRNRLAHLTHPWQTYQRSVAGAFVVADGASSLYETDSMKAGRAFYTSSTFYCDTTLAIIDYGESKPQNLTVADRRDFLYDASALTPVFLLRDFLTHDREASFLRYVEGAQDSIVYRMEDGSILSLAIDARAAEIRSASILYADPLYGDVIRTLVFDGYRRSRAGDFIYPASIVQRELGFDANVTTVEESGRAFDKGRIAAMIPATYHLAPEAPKPVPSVTRTDYNPHIHLLDLGHTDDKVLLVEFRDFLLAAEAPLETKNGELILKQAAGIAPGKPVKYFVFGHYHPHYIGGIRAFVHDGATVLSTPGDTAYVRQLVTFRHTLEPDSLELDPRPLKIEVLEGERVITDGETEMRIIHIGAASGHTDDYLLYYFPRYRLLFEDDLAWIANDKPLTAAGERQKGLYDAIVSRGLAVDTILQSWPVNGSRVRTVIDFKDLRRSVEMIPAKK
jgi:hypothetical protein